MAEGPSTSSNALLCAAPIIADECMAVNRAFVECKQGDPNPNKCLGEGEKVTACVLKTLRTAEEKCGPSFTGFQKCLHNRSRQFADCVEQQAAFEKCMGYKR
eukprot:CAMPEP_0202092788 /NCGR_PEP_ID=MMETSP0964-20121228/48215_1 /ASSEMBLY_ACC=CAM_ASM_000500 /TAXON_ID=4773 /ORGANISM="Schizochytrium aggregatum, Strain ATCC28209" /LENGTH=101 /DNA_ID=CAMNT_0048661033 /DNA_START=414 /DNA_END=719 /DNA_ORIENTATION=+